jgi:hypothetical protein
MSKFSATHNIVKRPIGNWRSIHGYGAAHLVNGRLLLCGFDISLHLWRDAKYDGILEANGIPFRIEIKSTGLSQDPLENSNSEFTFTSGGRSGKQISRDAESREKLVSTEDADFAIGVSSHDSTLWIVPVELLPIIGEKIKIHFSDIFQEKMNVFLGVSDSLDSKAIRDGFVNRDTKTLEQLCAINQIPIQNSLRLQEFQYQWQLSSNKKFITTDYHDSLVLDLWRYVFTT